MPRPSTGTPGSAWSGEFAFGPWWLMYSGPIAPTATHVHHAHQLVVASSGTVISGPDRTPFRSGLEVIPSGQSHRVERFDPAAVIVYLDRQSHVGQSLLDVAECIPIEPPLKQPGSWVDAAATVDRLVAATTAYRFPALATAEEHPAVTVALRELPDLVAHATVRLDEIAALTGLSPSRLSHLFTAQVGIPFRRYVLWLRLVSAAEHVANGATVTAAAHRAGFSDGAHFSRVFAATFGSAPSETVAHGRWLHPPDR